jgi:hypothetical protein
VEPELVGLLDIADAEGALVVLLVAAYVSGIGCGRDLESAVRLANETSASLDASTIASAR